MPLTRAWMPLGKKQAWTEGCSTLLKNMMGRLDDLSRAETLSNAAVSHFWVRFETTAYTPIWSEGCFGAKYMQVPFWAFEMTLVANS
jgi:hypothetical protein